MFTVLLPLSGSTGTTWSEDLGVFWRDFGVDGTLDGQAVRGIYDAPAELAFGGNGAVAATEPQFVLPTVQVPGSPYGKALVVPTGTFSVREHQPDGTGVSLLLLTRA